MMNRVEMNEEMMELVVGGAEIPVVDQIEMLRIPERKSFLDKVSDFASDACEIRPLVWLKRSLDF